MRGKRSPRGRTAAGTHTRRPRTEGPRTLARESPPLSHVTAAAAQHLPRANTAGHGRVAQSVRPMRGRQRRRRAARGWSVSRHRQLTVTRAARERLWYADPFIFKREMRRFFLKARENHAQRKLAVGRGAAGTPLAAGGAVDRGEGRGSGGRGSGGCGSRGRGSGRLPGQAERPVLTQRSVLSAKDPAPRPMAFAEGAENSRPHTNPHVGSAAALLAFADTWERLRRPPAGGG